MATEVQNHPEQQSLTSLVTGIVNDFQDLVKQQLQLTRREIEADLRKTREAASLWALGLGVLFLGAIVLCLMLVHLIHWLAIPAAVAGAADPAYLPLWVCYLIVGAVFAGSGVGLVLAGKKKLDSVHPLDNPATQALKENVQWLNTPK
jgi:hypothetical protein